MIRDVYKRRESMLVILSYRLCYSRCDKTTTDFGNENICLEASNRRWALEGERNKLPERAGHDIADV